ncbi:hypothetical protein LINGRAHAP2_LOCUS8882 [Linum grandiflorum]|jgi:factor associated with neutral sphingomyelinase activation
MLCN